MPHPNDWKNKTNIWKGMNAESISTFCIRNVLLMEGISKSFNPLGAWENVKKIRMIGWLFVIIDINFWFCFIVLLHINVHVFLIFLWSINNNYIPVIMFVLKLLLIYAKYFENSARKLFLNYGMNMFKLIKKYFRFQEWNSYIRTILSASQHCNWIWQRCVRVWL